MSAGEQARPFALPRIYTAASQGITVQLVPWHEVPLVSMHLILPFGAEADPPGKAGLADLSAQMLTLGTRRRSALQLAEEVDGLGASLSAHSGWDYTSLSLSGLSADSERLLELLLEVYTEPAFAPAEFEQLQQRRIAALVQQKDESAIMADERMEEALFRETPYGHPVYGTLNSVPPLRCAETAEFYRTRFLPAGSFMVMVGDLQPEDFLRRAEARLPSPGAPLRPPDFSPAPLPEFKTAVLDRPELTQSQIRLGHLGVPHGHPDYLPFEVANYVLGGGGFSSRLVRRVRSELGYTYGIHSSMEARKNAGPFLISTFTPTETTVPCMREILKVTRSFLAGGATQEEREEAVNFLVGSYPLKFETPGQIAQRIIQAGLHGLGLKYLEAYPALVAAVTLEEMGRAAREELHPDRLVAVVVGRAEAFFRELEEFAPVSRLE